MRWLVVVVGLILQTSLAAQGIEVEYDKSFDFSPYRSFTIKKGEVIIPREIQRVDEGIVHQWIVTAIVKKLTSKGLLKQDSASDLTVSYVVGSRKQADKLDLGPQILGGVEGNTPTAPGGQSRTWSREYQEGFVFVDLLDRNGSLRWRIKATTTGGAVDDEHLLGEVITVGFKKFNRKPKRKKGGGP